MKRWPEELKKIISSNVGKLAIYPGYKEAVRIAKASSIAKNIYKFAIDYKRHIDMNFEVFNKLNAKQGDKILEIGPGPCYLLWFLRKHGCKLDAIDIDKHEYPSVNNTSFYGAFRKILGLEQIVNLDGVQPFKKIPYKDCYDTIVAIMVTFSASWEKDACHFFLTDIFTHLKKSGKFFARFNNIKEMQKFTSMPLEKNIKLNTNTNKFKFICIWKKISY